MKANEMAGVAILGCTFAGIAGGQPHRLKRGVITEVVFTTVTVANVIVWVDDHGVPMETTTVDLLTTAQPTPVQSTFTSLGIVESKPTAVESITGQVVTAVPGHQVSSFPTERVSVVAAVHSDSELDVVTGAAVASSATPESPFPAETSGPDTPLPASSMAHETVSAAAIPSTTPSPQVASSHDRFPIGITYDQFKIGACKSEQEITDEWEKMKEYAIVRIYGMGCGIIPIAVRLAKANNQKIFAGIWLTNRGGSEDIDTVVKELISAVRNFASGNWDIISLISVENERVNEHDFTSSDAVDATRRARQSLNYAGYDGPIGAVETVPAMLENPTICENSDIALVNVHSFFDPNCKAEDSGQFVRDQVARVQEKCNKRVVVTEAGWPHQGDSHGKAIPSIENQKKAIDSLLSHFDYDLFLINAFDSYWKSDWAGSYNAEKYWGIIR